MWGFGAISSHHFTINQNYSYPITQVLKSKGENPKFTKHSTLYTEKRMTAYTTFLHYL